MTSSNLTSSLVARSSVARSSSKPPQTPSIRPGWSSPTMPAPAEAGEDVFDAPLEPLERGERPEHRSTGGKREGNLVHPEAGDLLDHVDLARDVARAPRWRDHVVAAAFEAEPPEERALLPRRRRQPDDIVRALRPI